MSAACTSQTLRYIVVARLYVSHTDAKPAFNTKNRYVFRRATAEERLDLKSFMGYTEVVDLGPPLVCIDTA
jgi:hypothetical protein